MLSEFVALFAPHATAILADETGAAAEAATAEVLESLDSDAADWLFDNWDAVLDALAA